MAMAPSDPIRYRTQIFVCNGKSCSKAGNPDEAKRFLKERIKELGLKAEARACTCSCIDYCDDSPNIVVYPEGALYRGVGESDWEAILQRHVAGRKDG